MDTKKYASQLISQLWESSDPMRVERLKTYVPGTSMKIIGLTSPVMKEHIKLWWGELKNWGPKQLVGLSKELSKTKILECRCIAYEILWKNKKALSCLTINDINELKNGNDNWVCVDTFCVMVSGWAWRNGQISDKDILTWLYSENRWERRAAVVSTVPLNLKSRGGTGDTKRTLMVCEKVVADRDDMVVKALSWALRELSKSNKPAVEEYMEKYKPELAGRVVSEVNRKLKTGKKNG